MSARAIGFDVINFTTLLKSVFDRYMGCVAVVGSICFVHVSNCLSLHIFLNCYYWGIHIFYFLL